MTSRKAKHISIKAGAVINLLGKQLVGYLCTVKEKLAGRVYLSGGTVRDLLLAREPKDIDFTVDSNARRWAAELAGVTGATQVPLGREEDAVRVVLRGRDIDFTSFREGAEDIEQELTKRDVAINSMAVCIDDLLCNRVASGTELQVIDPVGGTTDLDAGIIRLTSEQSITSDPLRMLRVFRFAATLGFMVEPETFTRIVRQKELIGKPAAERITCELELIMCSERVHETIGDLARSGLLFVIIPELEAGKGMEQPASHHLDVFDHCLATLACMEKVQEQPEKYFSEHVIVIANYLRQKNNISRLRWAALLHDLGKPSTVTIDEDRDRKITFYNHDRVGASLVEEIGRRLKWSREYSRTVASLVDWHMRPFHLCNVQRREELSLKACLRLVRLVGKDLPGLFLLSMADALAGKGEERPEQVEHEVAALFTRLVNVQREHVEPVHDGPPLLTGQDLIDELKLEPGPIFRKILDSVEEAHMEKLLTSRAEALEFARNYLKREHDRE